MRGSLTWIGPLPYAWQLEQMAQDSDNPWTVDQKAHSLCLQIDALAFGLFGKPRLQHAVFCIDSSGSMHGRLGRGALEEEVVGA